MISYMILKVDVCQYFNIIINNQSKMNENLMLISFFMLLLSSCSTQSNELIYHVNSHTVDCSGVAPMKCMLIQKGEEFNDEQWQNFYSKIDGFTFEAGYLYKLLVREEKVENPPADASSIKYNLIKILEKKEDPRFLVNGSWDVFKIDNNIIKVKRIRGAGTIPRLEFNIGEMVISGNDGCNNLFGTIIEMDAEALTFSPLAGTRKMCPNMSIADAFNNAMLQISKYKLVQNNLLLLNENNSTMLELNKVQETVK